MRSDRQRQQLVRLVAETIFSQSVTASNAVCKLESDLCRSSGRQSRSIVSTISRRHNSCCMAHVMRGYPETSLSFGSVVIHMHSHTQRLQHSSKAAPFVVYDVVIKERPTFRSRKQSRSKLWTHASSEVDAIRGVR